MIEMIERVAKALYERDGNENDWAKADGDCRRLYRKCARVAVKAMREPTDAMLSAGDSMMPQIAPGQDITTGHDALKDAWPAMIDAALRAA